MALCSSHEVHITQLPPRVQALFTKQNRRPCPATNRVGSLPASVQYVSRIPGEKNLGLAAYFSQPRFLFLQLKITQGREDARRGGLGSLYKIILRTLFFAAKGSAIFPPLFPVAKITKCHEKEQENVCT